MRYLATLAGAEHELEIDEQAPGSYAIKVGDTRLEADVKRIGSNSFSIIIGNRAFDFDVIAEGEELVVSSREGQSRLTVIDVARRARRSAAGARHAGEGRVQLKAMMPGRVVNVLVNPGDEVADGQGIVVIEAMKMENEVKSPKAGKVTEIKVATGQAVEKGETLAIIE